MIRANRNPCPRTRRRSCRFLYRDRLLGFCARGMPSTRICEKPEGLCRESLFIHECNCHEPLVEIGFFAHYDKKSRYYRKPRRGAGHDRVEQVMNVAGACAVP